LGVKNGAGATRDFIPRSKIILKIPQIFLKIFSLKGTTCPPQLFFENLKKRVYNYPRYIIGSVPLIAKQFIKWGCPSLIFRRLV
jgi:hypothetical protein